MKPYRYQWLSIGTAVVLFFSHAAAATIYRVNGNVSTSGDGSSWTNAIQTLQEILPSASAGDSVWVAGNTTNFYRTASALPVHDGVVLLGGFPPTGNPGIGDRDPTTYVTLISGDFDGDDTAGFGNRMDNSTAVLSIDAGAGTATLVDGFKIQGGSYYGIQNGDHSEAFFQKLIVRDNGDASPVDGGAGFHNGGSGANPTIEHCRFEGNQGKFGGALSNPSGSTFLITNCEFVGNTTVDSGSHLSTGGAIWTTATAGGSLTVPRLQFCTFESNVSEDLGGAIYLDGDLLVLNSTFKTNSVGASGGAIFMQFSHLTMQDVIFQANATVNGNGGAIFGYRGCDIDAMNCLFFENISGGTPTIPTAEGGAIYATEMSKVSVLNTTVTHNHAVNHPGLYILANSVCEGETLSLSVQNCILWDNIAYNTSSDVVERQLHVAVGTGGTLTVDYDDIDDGSPGDSMVAYGIHDIDLDPQFVNSTTNFRLKDCSPCIDAADSLVALEDIYNLNNDANTTCSGGCNTGGTGERVPDLDLRRRVVDGPVHNGGVAENVCHVGCPYIIDMGAYEFPYGAGICNGILGDLNGDGLVNGLDIQPFVDCIIHDPNGPRCPCGDFDDDGHVRFLMDVPCFIEKLLYGTSSCESLILCDMPTPRGSIDCNGNGVLDVIDVAYGTSQDCNNNGIPDECDVAEGGGSNDVNGNGIPDECETDCNGNGVPDSWDISHGGFADLNANGIPDVCEFDCNGNGTPDDYDIARATSNDCNSNGIPDECETDCNSNGVPDDCDIASSTSQDCNNNGIPDECDLSRTMLPSFDCNDNGIPDECDIASGYSLDSNHNHIPDECEGGGRAMMSQGGESGGEGGGAEFDEAAAWDAFWNWYADEIFGEWDSLTGPEKFNAVMDELAALGLPRELPW